MPNFWDNDPLVHVASQSDVRKQDDYFAEREATLSKQASRKLGTREKRLASKVFLSADELAADAAHDQTPGNLAELATSIAQQKNPALKQILLDEQNRLSYGTILGMK